MSALDCFAHSVTLISGIGRWTAIVNDVAFLLSRVIWENKMIGGVITITWLVGHLST